MALDAGYPNHGREFRLTRAAELTCFALCVAQVVYVAASFVQGTWLIDPSGQPIATDFVNVWAAGRQVLDGNPSTVYDIAAHKSAEVAAVGHGFDGEYPWLYPPTFLFVAMLLALIPYVIANVAWLFLTFPAYVAAIRGIVGHRAGVLFACAFPGILSNIMAGQNGFVTAALFGGALMFMERRPLIAGVFVGLLSYKPHLGILIPLVLLAGGHWRAIAAAAVTVALLALASWAAFGLDAWTAFVHSLTVASQSALEDGRADWAKLQSIFGLIRMMGGSATIAWIAQYALAGGVALALCALWRSKARFEIKAAALIVGALLATPYIFLYDLVVLAVAVAFLIRASIRDGQLPGEVAGLAAAALLVLIFPLAKAPVGFAAVLVVGLLVVRRVSRAAALA
jgi:Glycosyltransferase family 87